jgi:Ca-activated chloride channel family protein
MNTTTLFTSLLTLALAAATTARAQFVHVSASSKVHAQMIIPQARSAAWHPPAAAGGVQISEVNVGVEIVEQVATTTLDIALNNPTGARLEAQIVLPVPDKAALRGFTFQGAASEAKAELLTKEEARRLYDSIVASTRDPALLEFIGFNLIRSSVFPVEARGTQRVRLVYEHLLPLDGDRADYFLPRTESIDYRVPWHVSVNIRSKAPIGTVYSPSHRLDVQRSSEHSVTVRVSAEATTEPGPFRFSYLLQREGITASLLAYPDPRIGGGYFLLLASPPAKAAKREVVRREVILVLDRSGSMAGEKLEQVRTAALQVLEGLEDGEAFNIVVYHESVETFSPEPVIKNAETMRAARAYIRGVRVRGGTNIHDALLEALRIKPTPGCLPIVLFLTDGLPTVGQTSEKVIREAAKAANRHERRIFTFGVGVDVNTPLLDKLALETRGTACFVLPKEDVEVKVGQVFKRLSGPMLAAPTLQVREAGGRPALGRVRELLPAKLPDVFEGDQIVVLGQYTGDDPINFVLSGNYLGRERAFKFAFTLDKATTKNAFVPRLWASRRIAVLTDAIRDLGAEGATLTAAGSPRMQELVDEIVRLSKEFGILTEYTAFFAREGTDLSKPADIVAEARKNFDDRAMKTRSGYGSVNQEFNNGAQRAQTQLNGRNYFLDDRLNRVEISTVQQVNDKAFYKRGNRWLDSSLIAEPDAAPKRTVSVGSEEFLQLARRLAAEGRQGTIALNGEILLRVDGETILVK